jgi:methionine-S-sulfoxide reductase
MSVTYFSAGCFWNLENRFSTLPGITKTRTGYCGGKLNNPNYFELCDDFTCHAETVEVNFDTGKITFIELLQFFFSIHNPTMKNRQGIDIGPRYRSSIFYTDTSQRDEALSFIFTLNEKKIYSRKIVTEVCEFKFFFEAEDEHQQRYIVNKI